MVGPWVPAELCDELLESMMSLESNIAELVQASNALTGTVNGKIADIDRRVATKVAELESWRNQARDEFPVLRMTRNQFGNVLDNALVGWGVDAGTSVTISARRDIVSGAVWSTRDEEEKKILTLMGMAGEQYFQPMIRILKLTWKKNPGAKNTLLPFQVLPMRTGHTVASYARILRGSVSGYYLQGAGSDWSLCGEYVARGRPGAYAHCHPHCLSDEGEVELIWPAAVAGYFPLNKEEPSWGWFDHRASQSNFDISI